MIQKIVNIGKWSKMELNLRNWSKIWIVLHDIQGPSFTGQEKSWEIRIIDQINGPESTDLHLMKD